MLISYVVLQLAILFKFLATYLTLESFQLEMNCVYVTFEIRLEREDVEALGALVCRGNQLKFTSV